MERSKNLPTITQTSQKCFQYVTIFTKSVLLFLIIRMLLSPAVGTVYFLPWNKLDFEWAFPAESRTETLEEATLNGEVLIQPPPRPRFSIKVKITGTEMQVKTMMQYSCNWQSQRWQYQELQRTEIRDPQKALICSQWDYKPAQLLWKRARRSQSPQPSDLTCKDSRTHSSVSVITHQEEQGFPGGSVVKNPPLMQETQEMWEPTPVFLPGKFHRQRSLAGYHPWGCRQSDATEQARANKRNTHR